MVQDPIVTKPFKKLTLFCFIGVFFTSSQGPLLVSILSRTNAANNFPAILLLQDPF